MNRKFAKDKIEIDIKFVKNIEKIFWVYVSHELKNVIYGPRYVLTFVWMVHGGKVKKKVSSSGQ